MNTGGNTYELIDENNGQCLTIPGNSTANGAAPFVYTCGGGGAQYFTLVPATDTKDFRVPTRSRTPTAVSVLMSEVNRQTKALG